MSTLCTTTVSQDWFFTTETPADLSVILASLYKEPPPLKKPYSPYFNHQHSSSYKLPHKSKIRRNASLLPSTSERAIYTAAKAKNDSCTYDYCQDFPFKSYS